MECLGSLPKRGRPAAAHPYSTLNRRKLEGRLHTDESDRVVRFAALQLMQGDDEAAVNWLRTLWISSETKRLWSMRRLSWARVTWKT